MIKICIQFLLMFFMFSCSLFQVYARDSCGLHGFQLSEQSFEELENRYSNGVFEIRSGPKRGTAYLIDSEHGYALTSAHVVIPSIENSEIPVTASGASFEGEVSLSVIESNLSRNADFALLKFEDPKVVTDIHPLDVSTRLPRKREIFLTLGWGQEPDELQPLPGEARYVRPVMSGLLRFREDLTAISPGDSGSPLIDRFGMVVGTLSSRVSNTESHYASMRLAIPALLKLTNVQRVNELGSEVLAGKITDQELLLKLDPSNKNLRNFHLISWAGSIAKQKIQYERHSKLFGCPILPAYNGRDLNKVAIGISNLAPLPQVDLARFYFREGKYDASVNEINSANLNYQSADSQFKLAIRSFSRRNPSSDDLLECLSINEKRNTCSKANGSKVLSAIYRDQALVYLNWSSLAETDDDRLAQLDNALTASKNSIITTDDSKSLGITYSILGDVQLSMGRAPEAARAYASAYSEGLRSEWVIQNFEHSTNLIEDEGVANFYSGKGIQNAAILLDKDLNWR